MLQYSSAGIPANNLPLIFTLEHFQVLTNIYGITELYIVYELVNGPHNC